MKPSNHRKPTGTIHCDVEIDLSQCDAFFSELTPLIGPALSGKDGIKNFLIGRCLNIEAGVTPRARNSIGVVITPRDCALKLLAALRAGEITGETFVASLSHSTTSTKKKGMEHVPDVSENKR